MEKSGTVRNRGDVERILRRTKSELYTEKAKLRRCSGAELAGVKSAIQKLEEKIEFYEGMLQGFTL